MTINKTNDTLIATKTLTPTSDTSIKKIEVDCKCPPIDKEGFISEVCDVKIIKEQIKELEIAAMPKVVAIVLHRTDSSRIDLTRAKEKKLGTHFYIDKDGTIKQVASLNKYCNHVGNIQRRMIADTDEDKKYYKKIGWNVEKISNREGGKSYPNRYPMSSDSIGIEVVGKYFAIKKSWEELTELQEKSVKALYNCLIEHFKLDKQADTYTHDQISYKTPDEGTNVLKSIRK